MVITRQLMGSLLAIPWGTSAVISLLDARFPAPEDPDNYLSHVMAWMFVTAVIVVSLTRAHWWDGRAQTRRTSTIRYILAACLTAVILDVVADVVVPAFVLKIHVANAFAGPLFVAMPVSFLTVATGFLVVRRPTSN